MERRKILHIRRSHLPAPPARGAITTAPGFVEGVQHQLLETAVRLTLPTRSSASQLGR